MAASRTTTVVAGLAALAGLTFAVLQWRRVQAANHHTLALNRQIDLASDELQRLDARRRTLGRQRARLQENLEQATESARHRTVPGPTLDATDPALLRKAVVRARASAALRFRRLLQSLHLPADQAAKLEGILEEYELHARDIWEAGNLQGVPTTDPALWELMRPDYEKMRADVTGLIGEAGFNQVDQYNRTLVARDFSTGLVGVLYYSKTPVSAQQAEQLVPIIASLSPAYQQGHAAVDLYTIDWSTAAPQLASVLSPPQLAALQAEVAARQAYVKLSPLVNLSIGPIVNAAGSGEPPAR